MVLLPTPPGQLLLPGMPYILCLGLWVLASPLCDTACGEHFLAAKDFESLLIISGGHRGAGRTRPAATGPAALLPLAVAAPLARASKRLRAFRLSNSSAQPKRIGHGYRSTHRQGLNS
jgi:hypothetical protein